jgi:hypothetical protein
LVKAFDTLSREALFAILRRFGLPDHFINSVIRLHSEAKLNIKIGEEDAVIDSLIGVRQGSCEGPVLFLYMIQAVMETVEWPDEVTKPQFRTREHGETHGVQQIQEDGAFTYEFWVSLFADDCALVFNTREQLASGTEYINNHFSAFGLQMHKKGKEVQNQRRKQCSFLASSGNINKIKIFFMEKNSLTVLLCCIH